MEINALTLWLCILAVKGTLGIELFDCILTLKMKRFY